MTKNVYMKTDFKSDAGHFGIRIETSTKFPGENPVLYGPTGSIPLDNIDLTRELETLLDEYIHSVDKT